MSTSWSQRFGPGAALILSIVLCLSAGVVSANLPRLPTTVTYTVTFDATWSVETHPLDFPPNPHFSWLIGGTHDDQMVFWQVGQLASLGIQRMAEWGSKTPFDEEVEAAITAGHAGEVICDDVYIATSPGTTSEMFTVTQNYSLVTLVSMIAPSPDWFVGVSGLDLFEGGAWVEEIVVELQAYDAGTDSSPTYTSPNQPTVPHEPISLKTDGPFVGGVPLGTFTFTLMDPLADVPAAGTFTAWNFPNPFNPQTVVTYNLPADGWFTLGVYDLRGRLVRLLLDRNLVAGEGNLVFDGRDARGRELAAGTYLLRVNALGQSITRKMSLVR